MGSRTLIFQLLGSAAAILLLVGLVAWAGIGRATPALDAESARVLLADEFPDDPVDAVWIAADGAAVVARSGDEALILWRKGDGYVARSAPWSQVEAAAIAGGRARLKLADAAPRLAVSGETWPPASLVGQGAAA